MIWLLILRADLNGSALFLYHIVNELTEESRVDELTKRREELRELVLKYFPFPTANPGQLEAIIETVRIIRDTAVKHIIIQAPTGIGKSVIATTVHKCLAHLDKEYRSTIITATKGLQDQYSETDSTIVDLKGRTNYGCAIDKGPYNSAGCRSALALGRCSRKVCPYLQRRNSWCASRFRSTNNSFQIEACEILCMMKENKADLIIADECHELDDHIIEHTQLRFAVKDFYMLGEEGYGTIIESLKLMISGFSMIPIGRPFKMDSEMIELLSECESIQENLSLRILAHEEGEETLSARELENIGTMMEFLQTVTDKFRLFNQVEGDPTEAEWILNDFSEELVTIKSVYASQVAEYALFRKADVFLHMSATICGFSQYARTLGLKDGEWVCMDIPNPIPLPNRQIFLLNKFKVNSSFTDWEGMTALIDNLIDRHGMENGIIHTVSFKLGDEIIKRSKHKARMLSTGNRDEIVSWLSEKGKGRIVLSPSIEKGYDFKGDVSRWQIIAKVPWGYLGDPFVKMNSERDRDWYSRKAILRIVQACGRSVRGVTDHAKTYIIDSSFGNLMRSNFETFPSWYTDSLVSVGK